MVNLENEHFRIEIKDKGAELCSFLAKETNIEYLWSGNPKFWGRHAPILFPIVGKLKKDTYTYGGKEYQLNQHGFARDQQFKTLLAGRDQAVFQLKENPETLASYPFPFRLRIAYGLDEAGLNIDYEVQNSGDKAMPFSIGAHPAFNCPLQNNGSFEDYDLIFDQAENADRYLLEEGLFDLNTESLLDNASVLPLNYKLFEKDAIVLKHLKSSELKLVSRVSGQGLAFSFAGFPYLGIWTKPKAPFICIEPWFGLADHIHHQQDIFEKEGILVLEPGESFVCTYSIQPIL